jgi:predicted small lipoprotein YifL
MCLCLVCACGQRGPLYLPEENTPVTKADDSAAIEEQSKQVENSENDDNG